MIKEVSLSILSIFLLACVSNDAAEVVDEKPIEYVNLTLKEQKKLVKEYWVVKKRQHPKYPKSAAKKGLSGCVELIVGINKEGKSSGYKVNKSYPKGVFDKHAAALKGWQWSATAKNIDKTPILTTIQLDFMSGSLNKKVAKSECGWRDKV